MNIPYVEDSKREEKYREMERLGQELKVPVPGAFLQIEVFDGQANRIHAHRQRSHSWNRNAYNWFFTMATTTKVLGSSFSDGNLTARTTNGEVRSGDFNMFSYDVPAYLASAGISNYGIVVGSGSEVEDFNGYKLSSLIANGTGAGQLTYQIGDSPSVTWDAPSLTFSANWVRYFNNNSGGDISINEVGLVGHFHIAFAYTSTLYVLVSRDVLASTLNVPDTGQLKVTYTINMTYPE
ncbi:MAG: hypothetical protein RBS96_08875 [Dehalococcoidales bacterium]|nr:hypothetical protein [Dehalococcoidales bacterium]